MHAMYQCDDGSSRGLVHLHDLGVEHFNLGGVMLLVVYPHSEFKMVDQEWRCVVPCMCVYICDVITPSRQINWMNPYVTRKPQLAWKAAHHMDEDCSGMSI